MHRIVFRNTESKTVHVECVENDLVKMGYAWQRPHLRLNFPLKTDYLILITLTSVLNPSDEIYLKLKYNIELIETICV